MNKILLLCPDFFEYKNIIVDSLKKKGQEVDSISLTFKYNFFTRILRKIYFKFVKKIFDKHFYKSLNKLGQLNYDKVVVIFGGDFLSDENIKYLKNKINGKFIFYAWDSMANYKNIFDYIDKFDKVITFDKSDATKYNFQFLPLFYTDDCLINHDETPKYDYSFIGTMARTKSSTYIKLFEALPTSLNGYEYFYFPSFLTFMLNKIFHHKEMKHFTFKNSHFKEMKYDTYLEVVKNSKIILDVARKNQNGLTMRTIESLASSKKIITTNANISSYDFYNKNNIIIFDGNTKGIDEEFFSTDFDLNGKLSLKYSIHQWVDVVFELQE